MNNISQVQQKEPIVVCHWEYRYFLFTNTYFCVIYGGRSSGAGHKLIKLIKSSNRPQFELSDVSRDLISLAALNHG